MKGMIYRIDCSDGTFFVGAAVQTSIEDCLRGHLCGRSPKQARNHVQSATRLHAKITLLGGDEFTAQIVEDGIDGAALLKDKERHYIDALKPTLNQRDFVAAEQVNIYNYMTIEEVTAYEERHRKKYAL